MTPREGRILHLAQRTDARDTPAREPVGNRVRLFLGGGQADGGNSAPNGVRAPERLGQVRDSFHVDEAIEAGNLESRIGLETTVQSVEGVLCQRRVSGEWRARTV